MVSRSCSSKRSMELELELEAAAAAAAAAAGKRNKICKSAMGGTVEHSQGLAAAEDAF